MARGFVGAVAIALALVGPAATEAAGAVYRDPPSYEGRKSAPKTQAAPLPDPVSLSPEGLGPHLVVDDAGTAHIVWAEGGDQDGLADRVIYCRLKRGARACDIRHTLRAGPESSFNTDYQGPRIVRVGNQLVAFSKRYPVVVEKPDGGSSSTVWAWTSNDGGTTWSDPAIVGKYDLGDMVVIGSSDSPIILSFGYDAFCGLCITAYQSGQYSGSSGNLATRSNDAYYPQMELVNGLPVVSWVNLDGTTHLRRWTGQGSVIDPNTWTQPTALPDADETDLAGGPSGLSLISASRTATPRQFKLRTVGAGGFGAPVPVTPAKDSSPIFGTLEQDAGGRLLAAWSDRNDFAKKDGLWLRAAGATPGGGQPSFAPAQRSIRGIANGQIDLAGTVDGGGFLAFNHTGGVVNHGEIMAGGFGNQTPNGQRGLGDIPGGGASGTTCQKVKFGSFTADAAAGCFLHGTERELAPRRDRRRDQPARPADHPRGRREDHHGSAHAPARHDGCCSRCGEQFGRRRDHDLARRDPPRPRGRPPGNEPLRVPDRRVRHEHPRVQRGRGHRRAARERRRPHPGLAEAAAGVRRLRRQRGADLHERPRSDPGLAAHRAGTRSARRADHQQG